jgi:CDGSH-type Zn-finger protein
MGTPCGCGRSPTGFCEGWHGLTTEEYMVKMKEYKEQKAKETINEAKAEENE